MSTTKEPTKPFYKKPTVIILLFIFFPPIGIPILFKFLNKPSTKSKKIISIIWGVIWLIVIISSAMNSYRTYDIGGKRVTITCGSYCSYIDSYGDKDTLKILAKIGVENITSAPEKLENNQAVINVKSSSPQTGQLVLEISNDKLTKVYNKNYSSVIYYSTNSNDETVDYPADSTINAIKKTEDDKKAAEKAAADAKKAKEEADAKAAEEKYPPEYDSINLCEETFHNRYPYSGSEVHSILGVIANTNYGTDSYLYKVNVTIENAFGAKRDTTMECVVKKINSSTIQITSFYIY